tara:strand:+ start:108 stop:230 length:123 start_codon:yes stop_codon:yes gene_type:complete
LHILLIKKYKANKTENKTEKQKPNKKPNKSDYKGTIQEKK